MSGGNPAFETLETSFHQDLNGDGTIGIVATLIQTDTGSFGSTSLTEVGVNYYLFNGSGTGPEVTFGGVTVVAGAGQFSGWAPIGAVQTATGYDVAWKDAATNQYSVWTTDSSGNFVSSTGAIAATSATLEAYETTLHQDLNGDGTIGIVAAIAPASQAPLVSVANNDTFVFPPGGNTRGIADTASATTMHLDAFSSTAGNQLASFFHDAQAHFHSANDGRDTAIDPSHHDSAPAMNFHLADLHASHFVIS